MKLSFNQAIPPATFSRQQMDATTIVKRAVNNEAYKRQDSLQATISINNLNSDILMRIFDYLDFDDKIRLRRTCKRWNHLISIQLRRVKALRLGRFEQGGYRVTSGLDLKCDEHYRVNKMKHRQETGTLFNETLLQMPADFETQCHSINRYDYLHRALKQSYQSITMLSLGSLHISYRLLIALTNNLPNLEHLELINCASKFDDYNFKKRRLGLVSGQQTERNNNEDLPSMEVFNSEDQDTLSQVKNSILSNIMYNQHESELLNIRERIIRSTFVRDCNLIREAKSQGQWSNMRHLLIKECNLMNEFTLSLLLSLTSNTLVHLEVEKNQYLTGEFLNYCGPRLNIIKIKHCPSVRQKFVDEMVKIRKLLGSTIKFAPCSDQESSSSSSSLKLTTSSLTSNAARFAILFNA